MIIRDVVTMFASNEDGFLLGSIYGDSTGTFKDGESVITKPIDVWWQDPNKNTFAIAKDGTLYQIEFWEEKVNGRSN